VQRLENRAVHAEPLRKLQATVVQIAGTASGRNEYTLENGQVWQQITVDAEFSINPGTSVEISRGALGSYWLSASTHAATRVRRIR